MACAGGGDVRLVQALLSAGAQHSLRAKDGQCALHRACASGCLEVINALLSAGAVTDLRNCRGKLPLDMAPPELRPKVELLIQRAKEEGGQQGGRWRGRAGAVAAEEGL